MEKLRTMIDALCAHRPLDLRHKDHSLGGDWKGWRDCQIEPDWILIYRAEASKLELGRTGSHSDLSLPHATTSRAIERISRAGSG
jgi:mRNA interferase YafQ